MNIQALTSKQRTNYFTTAFKESSTKLALENKNPSECLDILKAYIGFFKDRHIGVLPNEYLSQQNTTSKTAEIKTSKPANIDLKRFKKIFLRNLINFEGIWKDDNYEIGVKR